jgi:hypothetical protein
MDGKRRGHIKQNDININYSTIFLLPMVVKHQYMLTEDFISCYIEEDTQKKLVLCFDNSKSQLFKDLIYSLQITDNFLSVDYEDEEREVVVKFKVPDNREVDYNLFKIGRYTKFSSDYKEILLEYHGRKSGDGKCLMVLDAIYPDYKAKKYRADKMSALISGSTPVSINDLPGGETFSLMYPDREYYIKTSELDNQKGVLDDQTG